jgi:hypothetical protein
MCLRNVGKPLPDYVVPLPRTRHQSSDISVVKYSRTPLIRTLVSRTTSYPDRLGPSSKFVENSPKLTCLEISSYRIKYSTVLWLTEIQIRRGRKV